MLLIEGGRGRKRGDGDVGGRELAREGEGRTLFKWEKADYVSTSFNSGIRPMDLRSY